MVMPILLYLQHTVFVHCCISTCITVCILFFLSIFKCQVFEAPLKSYYQPENVISNYLNLTSSLTTAVILAASCYGHK